MWPSTWPALARQIATAIEAALSAAGAADAPALSAAITGLAQLPAPQVNAVQATVVRELLQMLHPDGLAGDDVHAVLVRCARDAQVWLPHVDVPAIAEVLTGALGVAPDDEYRSGPDRVALLTGATLVIADLARAGAARSHDHIVDAIAEIARSETVEMP